MALVHVFILFLCLRGEILCLFFSTHSRQWMSLWSTQVRPQKRQKYEGLKSIKTHTEHNHKSRSARRRVLPKISFSQWNILSRTPETLTPWRVSFTQNHKYQGWFSECGNFHLFPYHWRSYTIIRAYSSFCDEIANGKSSTSLSDITKLSLSLLHI